MKTFCFIFLLLFSTNCFSQEISTYGYSTVENLRIRNVSSLNGSIIGVLKKESKVKILNVDKFDIIDGIHSSWIEILTAENLKGYVFGGYVTLLLSSNISTEYDFVLKEKSLLYNYKFNRVLSATGVYETNYLTNAVKSDPLVIYDLINLAGIKIGSRYMEMYPAEGEAGSRGSRYEIKIQNNSKTLLINDIQVPQKIELFAESWGIDENGQFSFSTYIIEYIYQFATKNQTTES